MSSTCWSCGADTPSQMFCEHCNMLQPIDRANAFERLGFEVSFDVDQELVSQNYFKAQRLLHPDRFVGSHKTERTYSAQHAAAMNDAYETLISPIKRAQEMLRIAGFVQPNIEQQTLDDQELLLEVIELREQLLDADSGEQLNELKGQVEVLFDDNNITLSKAFAKADYEEAAKLLNRLRYLNKIRSEILQKMVA